MDLLNNFGKRNLPKFKVTKNIYLFYYTDICTKKDLEFISHELLNSQSCWRIRLCPYKLDVTYNKILKQLNTPYHKYDKFLDKLCLIDSNKLISLKDINLPIEVFNDKKCFQKWLTTLQSL